MKPEVYYFGTTSCRKINKIKSVTSSYEEAEYYARKAASEKGGDPVIYKIDAQIEAIRKTRNGYTLQGSGGTVLEIIHLNKNE